MIRLSPTDYRVVLTSNGQPIVIHEKRPCWWVQAKPAEAERVLAGVRRPVLVTDEGVKR